MQVMHDNSSEDKKTLRKILGENKELNRKSEAHANELAAQNAERSALQTNLDLSLRELQQVKSTLTEETRLRVAAEAALRDTENQPLKDPAASTFTSEPRDDATPQTQDRLSETEKSAAQADEEDCRDIFKALAQDVSECIAKGSERDSEQGFEGLYEMVLMYNGAVQEKKKSRRGGRAGNNKPKHKMESGEAKSPEDPGEEAKAASKAAAEPSHQDTGTEGGENESGEDGGEETSAAAKAAAESSHQDVETGRGGESSSSPGGEKEEKGQRTGVGRDAAAKAAAAHPPSGTKAEVNATPAVLPPHLRRHGDKTPVTKSPAECKVYREDSRSFYHNPDTCPWGPADNPSLDTKPCTYCKKNRRPPFHPERQCIWSPRGKKAVQGGGRGRGDGVGLVGGRGGGGGRGQSVRGGTPASGLGDKPFLPGRR